MNLPARVETIINELYNRNINLARGSDDNRRELTRKITEQICFEFGSKWGTKRADSGRPPSKDSIAYNDEGNSKLYSYDWQNGSTKLPHKPMGRLADITGQVFISVSPVNHLGGVVTGSNPGNNPPGNPPSNPTGKPYNESYAIQFGLACNKIYNDNPIFAVDPGMIAVHATRAAFDYYTSPMSWEGSFRKHLNGFRGVYGLGEV